MSTNTLKTAQERDLRCTITACCIQYHDCFKFTHEQTQIVLIVTVDTGYMHMQDIIALHCTCQRIDGCIHTHIHIYVSKLL